MQPKTQALFILFLLPLFLCMTTEPEEEHDFGSSGLLGKTVNFLIFLGGLAYFLYKPLRNFLEKRSRDIDRSLEEVKVLKEEISKKLRESNARLAALDKEIEQMKKAAETEGLKERERIFQLAQEEKKRIEKLAVQEVEMIVRSGIQELKEYAVDLAVASARERFRKKMTDEKQALLIDRSIERIGNLHEKSDAR